MTQNRAEQDRELAVQCEVTRIALAGVDGFALAGSGAIREHGIIERPTEDVTCSPPASKPGYSSDANTSVKKTSDAESQQDMLGHQVRPQTSIPTLNPSTAIRLILKPLMVTPTAPSSSKIEPENG